MSKTIRLTDLSPVQLLALTRLDDGQAHDDSVGARYHNLPPEFQIACATLVAKGLVEARLGWRETIWFRLTERGRAVLEKGEA